MIKYILKIFYYRTFRFKRKKNKKTALMSYLPHALRHKSIKHANFLEMKSIFEVFRDLGFDVDVVFYEGNFKNRKNYDLLFGFGEPIEQALYIGIEAPVILYSTGLNGVVHNNLTIEGFKLRYNDNRKHFLVSNFKCNS